MKKQCFVLTVFLLLISSLSISAQVSEKKRALKECETRFGKLIDQKLNLFEVNKDFVLEVEFTDDVLTKFSVSPKYYFHEIHPEWKEPDERPWIVPNDFQDILTKLDTMKPKGRIVSKGYIGVCTNSNCWYQDYYEDAFLEYASYGQVGMSSFFVSFFQNVNAEVFFKKEIKPSKYGRTIGNENIFRVHVSREENEGRIYYVRKKVYKTLKKGKVQTFQGAFVN